MRVWTLLLLWSTHSSTKISVEKFGIDLCDDPFDPYCSLRALDPDSGVTIPFETSGTTIYFDSRCPTQAELDTCMHINMTHNAPWDPQNIELSLHSRSREEEEKSRIVSDLNIIQQSGDVHCTMSNTPAFLTDVSPTLNRLSND